MFLFCYFLLILACCLPIDSIELINAPMIYHYTRLVFIVYFVISLLRRAVYLDVPTILIVPEDKEILFFNDTKLYI